MTIVTLQSSHSPEVYRVEQMRLLRARRQSRRAIWIGAVFAFLVGASMVVGEVSPARLIEGFPRLFSYIGRTLPGFDPTTLPHDIANWFWRWPVWSARLFDTLVIAFLATTMASLFAFALAYLGARNLVPRYVSEPVRRVLEFSRTVPELVFALIFVFAFGIGPFAGFLAVFVHSTGTLGKLFSETLENVDNREMEALESLGAGWIERMRFALVPQVLPNFVSYALFAFENNIRSASVLGFVGAGGIGQEIMSAIKQFQYTDVSALVVMVAALVICVDMISGRIRRHLIEA